MNLSFTPGLYKMKNQFISNGPNIPFLIDFSSNAVTIDYRGFEPKRVESKYSNALETISFCQMEFVCCIDQINSSKNPEVIQLMNFLKKSKID